MKDLSFLLLLALLLQVVCPRTSWNFGSSTMSSRWCCEPTEESLTKPNSSQAIVSSVKPLNTSKITESRVVPIAIKATQTGIKRYPTIRLGEIIQRLVFPDWIWKGSGISQKVGQPSNNPLQFALPQLTFDSSYSRFLKLFTTVVQFNNSECTGPSGRSGTCYHVTECGSLGGLGSSPCAGGLGVCCVFSFSCGQSSKQNSTYFTNGDGISGGACALHIFKMSSHVTQFRLDFEVFSLEQPSAGNCDTDRFVVSGQNVNNVIPALCGDNNDTHIYVEAFGTNSIRLSVTTRGTAAVWRIKVTQLESRAGIAPSYCLQYYTGIEGSVTSFNYNSLATPQYLNNLNYAICLRKAPGYCSITFSTSGLKKPFQIINANENGTLIVVEGRAGSGSDDCPFDYLVFNGIRLCGDKLNELGSSTDVDTAVTDSSSGPFVLTVRTNGLDVGAGFFLYYRQNLCLN